VHNGRASTRNLEKSWPLSTLPEFQSLPRVCFCAESQIKNSRQRRNTANRLLCREANKKLSTQKETLAKDFFTKSQLADSRQRISLPSAIFSLSAKKFLKITFLPPNFFYPQHTLIKNLCSKLAKFQLCLLYLKFLLLKRYFFRIHPI
jgi:hypothetical protein